MDNKRWKVCLSQGLSDYPLGYYIVYDTHNLMADQNATNYLYYLRDNRRAATNGTERTVAYSICSLYNFIDSKNRKIEGNEESIIREWMNEQRNQGFENSTITKNLFLIHKFFLHLEENGKKITPLTKNQISNLKPRISIPTARAIPPKILNAIYDKIGSDSGKLAFEIALITGLRAFEICGLKLSLLLEWESNVQQGNEFRTKIIGKGGYKGDVYIPHNLMLKIKEYVLLQREIIKSHNNIKKDPDYLILGKKGKNITPCQLSIEFNKAKKTAGYERAECTFHGLRENYGMNMMALLSQNKDTDTALIKLQGRMRHRQIESTKRYLRGLAGYDLDVRQDMYQLYVFLNN